MFYNTRVYQIFATDLDKGLARGGQIPWDIPVDRRWFKHVTTEFCSVFENSALVVGSKTFLNDFGGRALSNRRMRVLSRTNLEIRDEDKESVSVCHSLTDLFDGLDHALVVGGEFLYKTTAMFTDEIIETRVEGRYNCDQVYDYIHRHNFLSYRTLFLSRREFQVDYFTDKEVPREVSELWAMKRWSEKDKWLN